MSQTFITPDMLQACSRLWLSGETPRAIAAALGLAFTYVQAVTKERPELFPPRAMEPPPQVPEVTRPDDIEPLLAQLDRRQLRESAQMQWPTIEKIIRDFHAGMSMKEMLAKHPYTYKRMRRIASAIGWSTDWRLVDGEFGSRVGKLRKPDVLKRYAQRESLTEIGRAAGVTGERIRQVVASAGLPPRQQVVQAMREEWGARRREEVLQRDVLTLKKRNASRAQRIRRLKEYFAWANTLWGQGVTIKEIAHRYQENDKKFAAKLAHARRNLGEGWFPLRIKATRRRRATVQGGASQDRLSAGARRPEASASGQSPAPR